MKKKGWIRAAAVVLCALALAACGKKEEAAGTSAAAGEAKTAAESAAETKNDETAGSAEDRISIVCTNFAEYDFARQIVGDKAEVTMLLKPGAESHTYEPSPEDIIRISESDLFVYVGGDSDEWVADILESMDTSKMHLFRLMDQVDTVEEELVEGMEPEEEEEEKKEDNAGAQEETEEPEMDEHVWASPANAMIIMDKMLSEIEDIDPKNKEDYRKNASDYISRIQKLDDEFKDIVEHGSRKEIIVADRFPFRYFVREFGLTYYAAFPGCAANTQPSAQTVAFLIDKVKADKIPVVFHMELSNQQMAKSISEATGAKILQLNAVHNVTADDFAKGISYADLMEQNVSALKEALN